MGYADELLGGAGTPELRSATNVPSVTVGLPEKGEGADFWALIKSGLVRNLPGSALQTVMDLANVFIHPLDTVTGLGKTGMGLMQLLIPGEQRNEAQGRAFLKFWSDRYGGVDALKRTIATDPAGFMMDASSVLGGGGAALKLAGKVPGLAGAAKVGAALTAAGDAVNPLTLAGKGVVAAKNAIPAAVPQKMYQSALKMSTTLTPKERLARTKTGLEAGILPTPGGVEKVGKIITDLNDRVSKLILQNGSRGKIGVDVLIDRLEDLKKQYSQFPDPAPYRKAIEKLQDALIDNQGNELTLSAAQKLKQNTYKEIKQAYERNIKSGQDALDTGAEATRRALASQLREEIQKLVPEVGALNAEESRFIGLQESIERAASRVANRDIIGIGTPIAGVAGGVVTGSPVGGLLTAAARMILDNPTVKAKMATVLARRSQMPTTPGRVTAATRLAEKAGLETEPGYWDAQPPPPVYEALEALEGPRHAQAQAGRLIPKGIKMYVHSHEPRRASETPMAPPMAIPGVE